MLSDDHPFLISPPFGRWFRHPLAYSVLGSYTVEPRPGSRIAQAMRTVRPFWLPEGEAWTNRIGLRNPGLSGAGRSQSNEIVSLAPMIPYDWQVLKGWLADRFNPGIIEINISCPNVGDHELMPPIDFMKSIDLTSTIFKLQPLPSAFDVAMRLSDAGARYLHLSNTLPSPVGGVSGAPLREANLQLVASVAASVSTKTEIIAGGGIYSPEHLIQYKNAGARRFSMSTAWFWPLRARRVMHEITAAVVGEGKLPTADDPPRLINRHRNARAHARRGLEHRPH